MQKANQQAVAHNANINLVAIRGAEITYFNSFFTNFGTQSALIAGFIISSISSVIGVGATCNPFWIYLYWLGTAIAFATAMHVLLCSVYISVFGQGLALRGPLGSMIKAIDGMVVEQHQVLYAFVATIIFFALSTVGMYWIMMTPFGALLSTITTVVGMGFWHHYTLRIYNRFKYTTEVSWRGDDDGDQLNLVHSHPNAVPTMPGDSRGAGGMQDSLIKDNSSSSGAKKQTGKITSWLLRGFKSATNNSSSDSVTSNERARQSSVSFTAGQLKAPEKIELEYASNLCVKMLPANAKTGNVTTKEQLVWRRIYVIVRNNLVYFYNDKRSYESAPQEPMRNRPIELEGFVLTIESEEPPYDLVLTPQDSDLEGKAVELRCDTTSEVANWIEVLTKGIQIGKTKGMHNMIPTVRTNEFDMMHASGEKK